MRNIDWLCENDREQLMKLLAEGDSCEYCALEIEDDCGIRCNEGVRAWLDAEHVSGPNETANGTDAGLEPDSDLLEPEHDCQYGEVKDMDTREKLENNIHEFKFRHAKDCLEFMAFETIVRSWLDRQAAITEREQAEHICQLEAERDLYRKKLSGAVWYAQTIERMMEVDLMSEELKPCPFCGGEAITKHVSQLWEPRNSYWAACQSCHMSGKHYPTEAEAIAAWNTRMPEQAIAATLGERHAYEQRITGEGSDWGEIMSDAFDELMASASESCAPDELARLRRHIAATLGRGECENVSEDAEMCNFFECSECGCRVEDGELYHVSVWDSRNCRCLPWSFCPNCGAKVRKAVER